MHNFSAKLKEEDINYNVNCKNYYKNVFEWGKETLWWVEESRLVRQKLEILKMKRY